VGPDIAVSERVRGVARLRPGGLEWIAELPATVAALAERWELEVGEALTGGTAAYVCAATRANGSACVLKVGVPPEEGEEATFARSVLAHELAQGRGCVALLEHHEPAQALLLERLGPNLDELGLSVPEILEVVASTLRELWHPIPATVGLPTGADRAMWLRGWIVRGWEDLNHPCERAVIDRAAELCDRRAAAFDPATSVLVHGDAHGWNTLDAGSGRYKLVDIEGVRSDRANDLAVPMREYNEPLIAGHTSRLVRERAELLAGWCDVDPQAVWEWGYVERVSTGLAALVAFADRSIGTMALEVARRSTSGDPAVSARGSGRGASRARRSRWPGRPPRSRADRSGT
jgi:streptomycin 6-kinase